MSDTLDIAGYRLVYSTVRGPGFEVHIREANSGGSFATPRAVIYLAGRQPVSREDFLAIMAMC